MRRPGVVVALIGPDLLRVRYAGHVNRRRGENRERYEDFEGGHSSAPKASDAAKRLNRPPSTRASLARTQMQDLRNTEASMNRHANVRLFCLMCQRLG